MPHALWPQPLSAAQLRRLQEHQYSASGRSLLEPPLQVYWNWLVQQIPLWVAPNTLTIVGLLINVLTTAVLVLYCPTATEEVSAGPPHPHITSAKFIYVHPPKRVQSAELDTMQASKACKKKHEPYRVFSLKLNLLTGGIMCYCNSSLNSLFSYNFICKNNPCCMKQFVLNLQSVAM